MNPERRYADWRPVAVKRIPVEWWGAGAGVLTALLIVALSRSLTYLTVLAGGFVAHWATRQLVERRMKALRDDAEGGQFAVVLSLAREVPYGYDEGLVAFIDGWLVYTGRRCAFSVRREDALGLKLDTKRYGFTFRGPAGTHLASFKVAESGRFGKAFSEWARATQVAGDAVLPPGGPNETARLLIGPWTSYAMATLVLGAGFLLTAVDPKPRHQFLLAVAISVALPAAVLYAIEARRALSRLGKTLPYRCHRLASFLGIRPGESVTDLAPFGEQNPQK